MPSDDQRAALEAVAAALRPLHKGLIDVTTADYERIHSRVAGPAALFHLLIHDPFFAWLRPMSGLMADLDALLDEEGPLSGADLRARLETLLTQGPFSLKYLEILQNEPDVVMAHAALRRALEKI